MMLNDKKKDVILSVRDLSVAFELSEARLMAVNGVSYDLGRGETLGIVGESGSGKSVHAMSLLRMLPEPPARILSGSVLMNGQDILKMKPAALRAVRGRQMSYIFQDPLTSLNPLLTIGRQITEVIEQHLGASRAAALKRAEELLDMVRINDPKRRLRQYPHEFSGGMRQRVMIAIALACNPLVLIADEPTTALDVTIQAEIVTIMKELQRELGMSMIWITHDLGVVAGLADTIQVMYAGRIVERGPINTVFANPRNAYTAGLLRAARFEGDPGSKSRLASIPGQPPDMRKPPAGDAFAARNPYATERCRIEVPPLRQVEDSVPGHLAAAWYELPADAWLETA